MKSTIHAFFANAQRKAGRVALRQKIDGAWREWSWTEYAELTRTAARGLIALGVPAGGAVVIIGPNRPEWLIADLGALAAGAVPAPIYPTSTPPQAAYIAGHCEAAVAVVNDAAQLDKLRAHAAELPKLKRFVLMTGAAAGDDVLTWEQFLALGAPSAERDAELDRRLAALGPDELATFIYTSGTTGPPKAVMLTHGNLAFAAESNQTIMKLSDDEHLVSYLPLSHIAEQMLSLHGAAVIGYTVSCCERFEQLPEVLREVRPTMLFGVPRVWEKLQAKMAEAGAQASPMKRRIAKWARGVGLRAMHARMEGRSLPLLYPLAKRLVFSTVKKRIGLDRAWYCATGAAPISKATLEFFWSLDIPVYEVYGMSEVSGASTISTPDAVRVGAVGRPIPGTELKLAGDGEILMRGPHVCRGYYKDEAATREALDDERWMHSGDVGEIDAQGFVRITDRKKDLLKTSGGKFVAPQNIEGLLKEIPGVGQAVVLGDQRKYCVALLVADPPARGSDPDFLRALDDGVKQVNGRLAPYESIKKYKVLASEFSVESGELTPTLKVKRKVVVQRYASEIESLYA